MVKKITWLIVVRLLLVTLFFSIGALVFKIDRAFFYINIAAVYFLSLLYLLWVLKFKYLKTLVAVQLVFDALLETLIVLYTGSMSSVFIILYIVTILCASIIVSPVGGMLTMGFVSVLYVGQLYCAFYGVVPFLSVRKPTTDLSLLFYTAHVHIITFLMVGILAAVLSRKINQMEEKVREKERTSVMGELAAQIAHEIRNPLATISGSIEVLDEELYDKIDAKNLNLMKAIVTESARVSSIFEQFLDFSKLDQMNFDVVSIRDVLNEILMLLTGSGSAKNIELIDEFQGSTISIECDCNRIKQVFWNIIRNALEAMPDGGKLTIRVEDDTSEDALIVSFIDTGQGIDKKVLKELFSPLKSTKKQGSGLGLVIAHKIIEKDDGAIDVISEVNKGTTFVVKLPKKQIER